MAAQNILAEKNYRYKDHLSAYRVALMVILDEHVSYLDEMQDSIACDFIFTLMKMINMADMDLKSVFSYLVPLIPTSAIVSLHTRLNRLLKEGIDSLFELMQGVPQRLLCEAYTKTPFSSATDPFINKSSVFGLFLRRLNLSFEMMDFHESTNTYRNVQTYIHAYMDTPQQKQTLKDSSIKTDNSDISEIDLMCDEDEDSLKMEQSGTEVTVLSQRQSEFFIAQQADLLNSKEEDAMEATKLQKQINHLLLHKPQLHQTHFLQYLNMLRVKEYNASISSLYNYFDRSYMALGLLFNNAKNATDANLHDDVNNHRFYRYAALNVAIAHYRFGHREQAILALKEAIKIAHQTNDSICLQYALNWLYRLGVVEKDAEASDGAYLLSQLIHSSHNFKLPHLMSQACLSNAKHAYVHAADPALVVESTCLSDLSVTSHLRLSLAASSAYRAALWNTYGNDELSMVNSLILLETLSSSPSSSLPLSSTTSCTNNDEMICLSLCHLCRLLAKEGKCDEAKEMLMANKQRYSHISNQSNTFKFWLQQINFYQCLLQGNFSQADLAIQNIASSNGLESCYCRCLHFAECGEVTQSLKLLEMVVSSCVISRCATSNMNHLLTRCLILKSALLLSTQDTSCSLQCIVGAYNIACFNHYRYLQAIIICNMAALQLKTKKLKSALRLIKQALPVIFENQNILDQATALFIYAKCHLAVESGNVSGNNVGESGRGWENRGSFGRGSFGRGTFSNSSCFRGCGGRGSSVGVEKNADKVMGSCVMARKEGGGVSDVGVESMNETVSNVDDIKVENFNFMVDNDATNVTVHPKSCNRDDCRKNSFDLVGETDGGGVVSGVGGVAGCVGEMVGVMGMVCEKFQEIKAYTRLKEALVFQALLYHHLGMKTNRNKSASLHAKLTCYLRSHVHEGVNSGSRSGSGGGSGCEGCGGWYASVMYLNVL